MLIEIINDENLNRPSKLISFYEFKSKEKNIISGRESNLEEVDMDK